jgi:hypothetical protein
VRANAARAQSDLLGMIDGGENRLMDQLVREFLTDSEHVTLWMRLSMFASWSCIGRELGGLRARKVAAIYDGALHKLGDVCDARRPRAVVPPAPIAAPKKRKPRIVLGRIGERSVWVCSGSPSKYERSLTVYDATPKLAYHRWQIASGA